MNYYTYLGLEKNCSGKDIKKAYHKLALKWHPDKNTSVEAEEKFKNISCAYQILGDPKKRREYDNKLNGTNTLINLNFNEPINKSFSSSVSFSTNMDNVNFKSSQTQIINGIKTVTHIETKNGCNYTTKETYNQMNELIDKQIFKDGKRIDKETKDKINIDVIIPEGSISGQLIYFKVQNRNFRFKCPDNKKGGDTMSVSLELS